MPIGKVVPPYDTINGVTADYSTGSTLRGNPSNGSSATLHSARDSVTMDVQQPRFTTVLPHKSSDDPSSNLGNMQEVHRRSLESNIHQRVCLEITSADLPVYIQIQNLIDIVNERRRRKMGQSAIEEENADSSPPETSSTDSDDTEEHLGSNDTPLDRLRGNERDETKRIDAQTLFLKYRSQITDGQLSDVLKDFNRLINDQSLPTSDMVIVVDAGYRVAKLLTVETSQYNLEAMNILKSCIRAIERIGVEGAAEFSIQWRLHDQLAACYSHERNLELEARHYRTAIDFLSPATEQPERYPHMMNNLGNCYKKMGKFEDARDMLERAKGIMSEIHQPTDHQSMHEDFQRVLRSLADFYQAIGENDKAIEEYERILKGVHASTASPSERNRLKKIKRSLAKIYRCIGNNEKSDALDTNEGTGDILPMAAAAVVVTNDRQQENAPGSHPDQVETIFFQNLHRAENASKAGRPQEAIFYYEKALKGPAQAGASASEAMNKLCPLSSIHNNAGNCYMTAKQFDKAVEHFKEALRLQVAKFGPDGINDELAITNFNLGNLYHKLDREADGLPHFREAARIYEKLAPHGKPEYTLRLARVCKALGQTYQAAGHYQESVEAYEKAKEIYEETSCGELEELQTVTNNLGNAYEDIKEYGKAKAALEQSLGLVETLLFEKEGDIDLLNKKAACWNNLGIVYTSDRKSEEAVEYFIMCVDLRLELIQRHKSKEATDDLPGSLQSLARCWKDPEHTARAKEYFTEAIEKFKRCGKLSEAAKIAVSVCYECMGDETQAMAILES